MRVKLMHAIISGAMIAFVLGFYLIPETWQLMSQEPTFEPITVGTATLGIVTSVAIITITLLSFKLLRRIEK